MRFQFADSVLDCLDTKLLQSLKVVLHGFELLVRVTFPIRDFANDPKRIPGAV